MKIGIVCYPTLGGSGILATELGHQLALRGHQVHFITYEPPFRLKLDADNLFFHPVELAQYDLIRYPDYALALAVKMAEVSEQEDLDVLHVHYAIPHATSAFLAKQLLGTKRPAVVTTLHGTDITLVGRDPAYKKVVKFSIEHSDRVTAVSEDLRRQTEQDFGIKSAIDVVYNFFIPKKVDYEAREMREQLTPNGEKLLIHASNFRPVKRVSDVIKVLGSVRQNVDARLLLLGSGIDIDAARNTIHRLGLQDYVTFWGARSNVDACIAAADVLLLPSLQESFGLVALEAMAYGVPVVATNAGGIPEVVTEGVTGYLADVGDIETMARRVRTLLTDDDLHSEMAIAGRKRAEQYFGVDAILSQYESIYADVVKQPQ